VLARWLVVTLQNLQMTGIHEAHKERARCTEISGQTHDEYYVNFEWGNPNRAISF